LVLGVDCAAGWMGREGRGTENSPLPSLFNLTSLVLFFSFPHS
jgi:hypothetical protein